MPEANEGENQDHHADDQDTDSLPLEDVMFARTGRGRWVRRLAERLASAVL